MTKRSWAADDMIYPTRGAAGAPVGAEAQPGETRAADATTSLCERFGSSEDATMQMEPDLSTHSRMGDLFLVFPASLCAPCEPAI